VAAGADGLLVEVHPNPEKAWSDGGQSLDLAGFDEMMAELQPWVELRERDISLRAQGLQRRHETAEARTMEAVG
jgi:3-deoxy-7-phosphoheptulonate synthase